MDTPNTVSEYQDAVLDIVERVVVKNAAPGALIQAKRQMKGLADDINDLNAGVNAAVEAIRLTEICQQEDAAGNKDKSVAAYTRARQVIKAGPKWLAELFN